MFKESGLDKIIKPDGRLERWEGSFDFVSNDKLKEKIVEIVSDEKNYIDKGGAGTVFDLGAYCINPLNSASFAGSSNSAKCRKLLVEHRVPSW